MVASGVLLLLIFVSNLNCVTDSEVVSVAVSDLFTVDLVSSSLLFFPLSSLDLTLEINKRDECKTM